MTESQEKLFKISVEHINQVDLKDLFHKWDANSGCSFSELVIANVLVCSFWELLQRNATSEEREKYWCGVTEELQQKIDNYLHQKCENVLKEMSKDPLFKKLYYTPSYGGVITFDLALRDNPSAIVARMDKDTPEAHKLGYAIVDAYNKARGIA